MDQELLTNGVEYLKESLMDGVSRARLPMMAREYLLAIMMVMRDRTLVNDLDAAVQEIMAAFERDRNGGDLPTEEQPGTISE